MIMLMICETNLNLYDTNRRLFQPLRCRSPRLPGGAGAVHARHAQAALLRRPVAREDPASPQDRGHGQADRQAGLPELYGLTEEEIDLVEAGSK